MTKKMFGIFVAETLSSFVYAESTKSESIYTLYRNSALSSGNNERIHIATFDAEDGKEYNSSNCEIAKGLFQSQTGVTVHYWCEIGRFKAK